MEKNPIFDEFAETYDSWFLNPVGGKVFELELNLLLKAVEPEMDKTLLDVGIGTGFFATHLRSYGLVVKGIDPSEKMLEVAKKRGFEVKIGSGENIPFENESFDIVLAMTSMEFSKDPKKFLSEMVRVAKIEGKIVIAVLNILSLYGLSRRLRGLYEKSVFSEAHFYNYWELKSLLRNHLKNFKVSSSVFFNPSPPNWVIERADSIESFGQKYLKPFGALLVAWGIKES